MPSPALIVPLDEELELLEDELDELLEDELELEVLEDEDELLEELAVSVFDPPQAASARKNPTTKQFFIEVQKR